MHKKKHRKRIRLRKRKKLKRLIIAYLLRAIVILIPIIMIILMVCETNWTRDLRVESQTRGRVDKLLELWLWAASCFSKPAREKKEWTE